MLRSSYTIIADIVTCIATKEPNKTTIMYDCNLNSKQISHYLGWALNAKLIEKVGKKYTTTHTGREFMQLVANLEKYLTVST